MRHLSRCAVHKCTPREPFGAWVALRPVDDRTCIEAAPAEVGN